MRDKAAAEARDLLDWVCVPAAEPERAIRAFAGLEGHEYRYSGGQWTKCHGPEEFARYLLAEAVSRGYFFDEVVRYGRTAVMRRKVETPIQVLTTNLAPWVAEYLSNELTAGRDPRAALGKVRNSWLGDAMHLIEGKRFVVGYAFHCDSRTTPHFDLCVSRQEDGVRIGGVFFPDEVRERGGLGLVGPWSVAVDRQIRAGASISPGKRAKFEANLAKFHARWGSSAQALDIMFHRRLDAACESVLGPQLAPLKDRYAATVPTFERAHATQQLAQLELKRSRLLAMLHTPEISDGA